MTLEEAIKSANLQGYRVHNLFQLHLTLWQCNLRHEQPKSMATNVSSGAQRMREDVIYYQFGQAPTALAAILAALHNANVELKQSHNTAVRKLIR